MRKLSLIILFLALPVFGCYSEPTVTAEKKAQDEGLYTWDFGTIKEGELFKHDFIFKNESQKTLNIKSVNTSCGCTASEAKNKTLLPGEETSISVTFNSKGYSGATKQFVYVTTDDLDNPIIRYIIKADVVK